MHMAYNRGAGQKKSNSEYWPYYIFHRFISELDKQGYSKATRSAYLSKLTKFGLILVDLGYKHQDEVLVQLPIFKQTLVEYHKLLLGTTGRKGVINPSLNLYISAWHNFCRWYTATHHLKNHRFPTCKTFKVHSKLPCTLRIEKLVCIEPDDLGSYYAMREWCMIDLFCTAALRVNELIGIRVAHVDFINQSIVLDQQFLNPRRIYLDKKSIKYLGLYVNLLSQKIGVARFSPETYLFAGRRGHMLSMHELYRTTYSVTSRVFGFHVTPHMLRSACGRTLFFKCRDERLIQEFMGYKSVQTLQKYYAVDLARFAELLRLYHPRYSVKTNVELAI